MACYSIYFDRKYHFLCLPDVSSYVVISACGNILHSYIYRSSKNCYKVLIARVFDYIEFCFSSFGSAVDYVQEWYNQCT